MALELEINQASPILKQLKHANPSITDGALTSLITGIAGKRIRVWRFHSYAAAAAKSCKLFSGTDEFPALDSTKSLIFELKGSDGVPVFTCNAGDDFKADPSDNTNWYFYIVYSID